MAALTGWQILGIVVGVIASFFTAIIASLPIFFAHLRVVMSNTVLQERKELSSIFISRIEYDARHRALQELIQQSIETSKENSSMLQELMRNFEPPRRNNRV